MSTCSLRGPIKVSTVGGDDTTVTVGSTAVFKVLPGGCERTMDGEQTDIAKNAYQGFTCLENSRRFNCSSAGGDPCFYDIPSGESLTVTPTE
jgi:hypothetical protein